jgi:hypothetical protein
MQLSEPELASTSQPLALSTLALLPHRHLLSEPSLKALGVLDSSVLMDGVALAVGAVLMVLVAQADALVAAALLVITAIVAKEITIKLHLASVQAPLLTMRIWANLTRAPVMKT